jgi:hypothetical protein
MSVTELLKSVQFVIDSDGNRTAVQLDLALWEELVMLLEDLEDAEEIEQAHSEETVKGEF